MAVISYRPASKTVTAASTTDNNGGSIMVSDNSLSKWGRLLICGTIRNSSNSVMTDAGVNVYLLAATGDPLTDGVLVTTVFTDSLGEYGVSLETISGTQNYAFAAFSPGN